MTRIAPRAHRRPFVIGVAAFALVVSDACSRGRPSGTVPSVVPLPADTAPRTDSARLADSAAAARAADSLALAQAVRDSIARDSLARDSALAAAPDTVKPPPGARTPGRRCQILLDNTPETRFQTVLDRGTGRYNTFVGGGVVARCQGQDVTLLADSAEFYDTIRVYYLFGNVRYREARANIDADRATYFLTEERIVAEQNVRAVLPTGSTMVGAQAEYLRAVPPLRQVAQLNAMLRPTITIVQRDSSGNPTEPAVLIADRVTVLGDSLFYAGGRVDITRTDLHATSDSAFMDEGRQFGRLLREPQIEGRGERAFTLRGRVIDLFSRNRLVERVLAVDSAHAVSGELDLRSDSIDLRVSENRLERAFAWGPSRARAVSPQRTITSDSLDVQLANQQVREVHAIRRAYAETAPDSTKLTSKERDWLRGDTVIARFDSAAANDTASRPRIRELQALGNASSFHQIPSDKGPAEAPNLSYVRGNVITVAFRDQEVQSVVVEGQSAGLYLEPTTDSTQAATPARSTTPRTVPRPPVPSPIRRSNGGRP